MAGPAAAVQAGASLLSSITAGKSAKKVAKIAAEDAAAARAQAKQIYDANVGLAQPTVDRGNAAGAQINALLGIGGNPAAANDALATWRNATGYQDTLAQGLNAVNSGYAARGALESGAAQKALAKYGAGLANQTFGTYLGGLQNQQAAGAGALGAVTGAGNAYGASVTSANQSAASAAANAVLFAGRAQQDALAGIANAAGTYFGQSSYRAPVAIQPTFGSGTGPGGQISYAPNALGGYAGLTSGPFALSRNPFG